MVKRRAKLTDIKEIMALIEQAKAYLKKQGVDQWQQGYPNEAVIKEDTVSGEGYVIEAEERIVAYVCVSFDGEESYRTIEGDWKTYGEYAVVHRMAVDNSYKGRGLASQLFQFAEELCEKRGVGSIKVDTDPDNEMMKHILKKNGFAYCGVIQFDNSDKIAFEKVIKGHL